MGLKQLTGGGYSIVGEPLTVEDEYAAATLLDPKYEYGSVPEAIAQVALRNISSAAQEKAKGEAKKKAQEELQKLSEKAPAPVKNLLKGLFK